LKKIVVLLIIFTLITVPTLNVSAISPSINQDNINVYDPIYFFNFIRNTTDILVQKALKLWMEHGNKSYFIFPVYNQLRNRVEAPFDTKTLPFFIYAFMSTGNYTYLKYAFRTADDIIKLNLTATPYYFAWLSQFGNKSYIEYAKKLTNNIIKDVTPLGLPGYKNKTYRLPWDVCSGTLAPLLKMYDFTKNKTYLTIASKVISAIFKYLVNNKTGLLNDGYKIINGSVKIIDNFQRVYSAGLIISNMLYLYLLSKNQTILSLLKEYVNAVNKYFWTREEIVIETINFGGIIYRRTKTIEHWAYRVYSNGVKYCDNIETNFFKLDYALLLYYMYIDKNSNLLNRIFVDLNTSIAYNTENYLFGHSPINEEALVYGQFGSLGYLITFLYKLGISDFRLWFFNHTFSSINAFMKEFGFVEAVDKKVFTIDPYSTKITLWSTAYLYSTLFLINSWISFPLTYNPNSDLPKYPYFVYPCKPLSIGNFYSY